MSSTTTPNHTTQKECLACGYNELTGQEVECPRCHAKQQLPSQRNRPRGYWLQVILFLFVLTLVAYPYLKQSIPGLENLLEPSSRLRRQGDALFRQQKWQQALRLYQQSNRKRDFLSYLFSASYRRNQGLYFYKMAICSLRLKQTQKAIFYAEKARQQASQWMLPYELLLRVHVFEKNKKGLQREANKMKKQFPRRWQMWLLVGNAYGQLLMHKEAIQAYQKGLSLNPKSTHLLNNLAWEYLRKQKPSKKDIQKAKKLAVKAFNISQGKDFTTLDTWAKALLFEGNIEEAAKKQAKAIAQAQKSYKQYKNRPNGLYQAKAISRAIQRMQSRLNQLNQLIKSQQPINILRRIKKQHTPKKLKKPTTRPTKQKPIIRLKPKTTKPSSQPTHVVTKKKRNDKPTNPKRRIPPLPRATHHQRSHQIFQPY